MPVSLHSVGFSRGVILTKLPKSEPPPSICWYCGCDDLRPITWVDGGFSRTGLVCAEEFCGATWVPKLVQGKWTHRK